MVSRTSQAVASTRAAFSRPVTEQGDPEAQASLAVGMDPVTSPAMRAHLEARTRFFDARVMEAVQDALPQVVIFGAGYDDRALRFRREGVTFFEVDHPSTQADKRYRLKKMRAELAGVVFIAADFTEGDIVGLLDGAGHDSSAASLFIVEGLLVYLDEATIVRLLSGARRRAAPGSRLAASLAVHPARVPTAEFVASANASRPLAEVEPWRTILPVAEHIGLLEQAGWSVVDALDDATLGTGAVPERSLLVLASPA